MQKYLGERTLYMGKLEIRIWYCREEKGCRVRTEPDERSKVQGISDLINPIRRLNFILKAMEPRKIFTKGRNTIKIHVLWLQCAKPMELNRG